LKKSKEALSSLAFKGNYAVIRDLRTCRRRNTSFTLPATIRESLRKIKAIEVDLSHFNI